MAAVRGRFLILPGESSVRRARFCSLRGRGEDGRFSSAALRSGGVGTLVGPNREEVANLVRSDRDRGWPSWFKTLAERVGTWERVLGRDKRRWLVEGEPKGSIENFDGDLKGDRSGEVIEVPVIGELTGDLPREV